MLKYALTIFISAFLVFQIQPIVTKFLMPLFGGASTVWIVCVVFFQVFLLLGYWYAYLLSRIRSSFTQVSIHTALLAVALLLFLPINSEPTIDSVVEFSPPFQIILTLLFSVGMPYGLLSASGPLIQNWFRLEFDGKEPYRLYALSNLGSLLGLLMYPFFVEPNLDITQQSWVWSAGFVVYFLLCGMFLKAFRQHIQSNATQPSTGEVSSEAPSVADKVLWVILAATASMLLLSVSNQLTLDIASIPFLWILPLVVYLITFIVCFEKPILYQRWVWMPLLLIAAAFVVVAVMRGSTLTFVAQLLSYSSLLFVGCMMCHGELYRCKPSPEYVTHYYLYISFGGAIGGLFVALVAPYVFDGYWEIRLIVVLLLVLLGLCLMRDFIINNRLLELTTQVAWTLFIVFVGFLFLVDIQTKAESNIYQSRNFFGVLTVLDLPYDELGSGSDPQRNLRIVRSGTIVHGIQLLDGDQPVFEPSSYYGAQSGVGIAIDLQDQPSVAVVGMGAATIATLCEDCESAHYFEIDPDMVALEATYFGNVAWLKEQGVPVTTIVGDGRMEISKFKNSFDVVAIDAFSGDAIPIHLLTHEALKTYFSAMTDKGVLAFHISNRHMNLALPLANLAEELGAHMFFVKNRSIEDEAVYTSDWVLLTYDDGIKSRITNKYGCNETATNNQEPLWTDKYSNVLSIINNQHKSDTDEPVEVICYEF